MAVNATKRFTLKRFQFFGVMAREYLVQINPVMPKAPDWLAEILFAGLCKSPRPAITRPHLKAGAQKKMVCGPAGCFHRGCSLSGTNLPMAFIELL